MAARIWIYKEEEQRLRIGHNWTYGRNPAGCRVWNTVRYLLDQGLDVDGFAAIRLSVGIQPQGVYIYIVVVTCRMGLVHSRFCV